MKCQHPCRPINAYYGRYQLVEATTDGLYARGQMHMPCRVPGCACSKLIKDLPEEKVQTPTDREHQLLTGDAELDTLEAKLREDFRALGLNY